MGIIFGFIVIAISVYGTGFLLYLDQGDETLCGALCGQLLFGWITNGDHCMKSAHAKIIAASI
jgi:hypothetical protein